MWSGLRYSGAAAASELRCPDRSAGARSGAPLARRTAIKERGPADGGGCAVVRLRSTADPP